MTGRTLLRVQTRLVELKVGSFHGVVWRQKDHVLFLLSICCVISGIILFTDSLPISRSTAFLILPSALPIFVLCFHILNIVFLRWVLTDPSNCCHCSRFLNPLVLMIWPSKKSCIPDIESLLIHKRAQKK